MSEPIDLTPASIEAIARRTAELMGSPSAIAASANDTLTRDDLRVLFRCDSQNGVSCMVRKLRIKPYAHGKYRRGDVDNAIARAAHRAQKEGRAAA